MTIPKNSRQMPSSSTITSKKDYCDLLLAWLQCNSERVNSNTKERCILKKNVKWTIIERDFTKKISENKEEKVMSRKIIPKYFDKLIELGLVEDRGDEYYYLKLLDTHEASLIEYNTLSKLMNTFQKNSINIYVYLFNQYYRNDLTPFVITMRSIKEYIGIAYTTTSNNGCVSDTLEILKRLGLLDYELKFDPATVKSFLEIKWVKNELPKLN